MKLLLGVFVMFLCFGATFSQEKKAETADKKSYSEEEVEKLVNERVMLKIKKLGKKNIVEFSRQLLKKEKKLNLLSLEIGREKERVEVNSRELDKKIKEFRKDQDRLLGCLDDIDKRKGKRISHLVKITESMRPAVAAGVLAVQDADISVEILGRLPAAKVSKIFNSMDKEISARLQKQFMNMKK